VLVVWPQRRESRRVEQAPGGPDRRAAHQRRGVVQARLGRRHQGGIAAVAQGVEHIADETVAPDALDRTLGEQGAEGRIVEPGKVGEQRPAQGVAGVEAGLAGDRRELVPGADGQAIVAAVDAVAHRNPKFHREGTGELVVEIGQASPRIELERGGEGVRRADVETGRAGAAVLSRRCVRGQFKIGQHRAQKQP